MTLQIPETLAGLQYAGYTKSGTSESVSFTTRSQVDAAAAEGWDCGEAAIGIISKSTTAPGPGDKQFSQEDTKKVGNFYFFYTSPQEACGQTSAVQELIGSQIKALRESLQTIELE